MVASFRHQFLVSREARCLIFMGLLGSVPMRYSLNSDSAVWGTLQSVRRCVRYRPDQHYHSLLNNTLRYLQALKRFQGRNCQKSQMHCVKGFIFLSWVRVIGIYVRNTLGRICLKEKSPCV
ncbi:hypothetical protein FKM82_029364 [Ascaphus truei]